MSANRSVSSPGVAATPGELAATARSILACPSSASLVVDGVEDVLAGMTELGMQDIGGQPTFSCGPGTPLATAARQRRSALLTLGSGLGADGSPDRTITLTLSGRLESLGREDCDCCGEVRDRVVMQLNYALLGRPSESSAPRRQGVPLGEFRSPDHHLNRGFLQRSVEHANACHQEELRRAVATTTGTRFSEVVGVTLTDLTPRQVDVQWVDLQGSHSRTLEFPRTARDTEELGELLRRELHAGLC